MRKEPLIGCSGSYKLHYSIRVPLYYSDGRKLEKDKWEEIEKDGFKLVCHSCNKKHFDNSDHATFRRFRFPITEEGRKVSIIG